jgi:hypothetical protein
MTNCEHKFKHWVLIELQTLAFYASIHLSSILFPALPPDNLLQASLTELLVFRYFALEKAQSMKNTPTLETHSLQIRPRFKLMTQMSEMEIAQKVRASLNQEKAPCIGQMRKGFIALQLPIAAQHYWSPQLSMTIDEEDGETIIRGLYGPRPSVWTMFVFFYAVIGLATLVITMIGLVNLQLNESSKILWFVPALATVFLSLYLVAYSGQRLGEKQMSILKTFFEESTGLDTEGSLV